MARTYEEYLKAALEMRKNAEKERLKEINEQYDALSKNVSDGYRNEMKLISHENDSLIDKAYAEKLITQKHMEQTLSDLGLSDSGLSRTEQAAIELSHNKNVSSLKNSTRRKLNSLRLKLKESLEGINTQRLEAERKVKDDILKQAEAQAKTEFNKREDTASTKVQDKEKAWNKVSALIYNNETPSNEKELYLHEYYLKYGFTEEEKLLIRKAGINYSSIIKKEELTPDEKAEIETERNISDSRKSALKKMCDEELLTRMQYNKDRNFFGYEISYESYIRQTAYAWYKDNRIAYNEYLYIINMLDA